MTNEISCANYLRFSAFLFSQNKTILGKRVFSSVKHDPYREGVYYFLWISHNSPSIPNYGKWAFHDELGFSSRSQEKAQAIYECLISNHHEHLFTPSRPLLQCLNTYERSELQQLQQQLSKRQSDLFFELRSLSNTEPQQSLDVGYYCMVGAAIVSTGILFFSIFSGRGAREIPAPLAGHVTVGSGHFPFPDPVLRLPNIMPTSSREEISRSSFVSRPIILVESGEGNDNYRTPTERNTSYYHRGTTDNHHNGWQGSVEQEMFEENIRSLEGKIQELIAHADSQPLREVQRQIHDLRGKLHALDQEQAQKIWCAARTALIPLIPKGPLHVADLLVLKVVYDKIMEIADVGKQIKDVKEQLDRLLEAERALIGTNDFSSGVGGVAREFFMSELRHN